MRPERHAHATSPSPDAHTATAHLAVERFASEDERMQPERADEFRWWAARIAVYFTAWTLADVAVFIVRSPQADPYAFLGRWLWVAIPVRLALLLWLVPRRQRDRSQWFVPVTCAAAGSFAVTFVTFWSNADVSRAFMLLEFVFSAAALFAASAVMRVAQGEDGSPDAERPR
jgi:FtsH-binding integral membrane protein